MDRRWFLKAAPFAFAGSEWVAPLGRAQSLGQVPAIAEDHFPSRLHQFVWRNWELANADRMSQVVQAKPNQIVAVGESMGLPRKRRLTDDQLRRIYITVIRQNWHLLPENQIIELLG